MSNSRSPYAEDYWQRWEMKAFELPSDHSHASPVKPEPEEIDMEAVFAEVAELKELALKQGKAEGYAAGHQQGLETGHADGLKEGLDKGNKKGYEEGYNNGAQKSQTEAQSLAELVSTSAKSIDHLHEDLGQALLALAVDIAQHVLHTELKNHPEQLLPLIKETLKDVEQSDQAVTLLLNPTDVSLVQQHLADDLAHNNWRLKADESIRAGGVEIKSALGHIDATLETRWRRALARLGPSLATSKKNTL